jgi:hypothetical protein
VAAQLGILHRFQISIPMLANFRKRLRSDPGSSVQPGERALVRIAVPLAFFASVALAYGIAHSAESAPSIAFENHFVFGAELLLLIFYSLLLLAVPLVRGVIAGELPIELTTKGARYSERDALKGSLKANQELLERVEAVEGSLLEQEGRSNENAEFVAEGLTDLASDIAGLRDLASDIVGLRKDLEQIESELEGE